MDKLLNLIFLQTCFICHKFGSCICDSCIKKFPVLKTGYCLVCDRPSEHGLTHKECHTKISPTQLIAFYSYENHVRECILRSKFNSKEFMILKLLCNYAFSQCISELQKLSDFLLVPIPLSKEKMLERGFNQAEVIAYILSKKISAPFTKDFLRRSVNTTPQSGNTRQLRFKNVENAFRINTEAYSKRKVPSKILLIDDITTSGATFLEASRVLLGCGVKEVRCLALSKKLFEQN